MDLAHPLGVALGQVVVDRDEVHALAGEAVEVDGQRRDEGLALARLHLGDPAEVQGGAAHELHVVVALADDPVGRLADDGEGLDQQVVEVLAPLARRSRNSTVLCRRASSVSACISGSSALMSGTSACRARCFLPSPARRTRVKIDMRGSLPAGCHVLGPSRGPPWPRGGRDRAGRPASAGGVAALSWSCIGMIAAYVAVFGTLTWRQQSNFGTFGFDMGIYDQGIWLMSRFKDPFITVRGLDWFGHHVIGITFLFVPFYWLGAGPHFLYLVETVWLGRRRRAHLAAGPRPAREPVGRPRPRRRLPALPVAAVDQLVALPPRRAGDHPAAVRVLAGHPAALGVVRGRRRPGARSARRTPRSRS